MPNSSTIFSRDLGLGLEAHQAAAEFRPHFPLDEARQILQLRVML
jgi:hypothetical protein